MLARIRELGIPPAWTDVWICPDPNGHLQATGVDAAGRKQYRYHDAWRTRRDAEKFDDMTRFARALPTLRERVEADLLAGDELTRERVLACAVRLLDRGFFRIGTEEYAVTNESYGLATMRKEHVTIEPDGTMVFDYPAKSGKRRIQAVVDPLVIDIVATLKRRRGGGPDLLAYRERRRWNDLRSPTSTSTSRRRPATTSRPRTSAPGARPCSPRSRSPSRATRQPQGGDHPRGQGDRALPRQHAGGLPRLLHRPARVRRLPRRRGARPRRDRARARGRRLPIHHREIEAAVLDLIADYSSG